MSLYEDVKTIFESEHAVDLFRTLYEATVPQVVRGSFGEFYTPYWLADHVIESSGLSANWSLLDPCCGSGTFVIAAIARLRKDLQGRPKAEILSAILERVVAIDLNPLAVLTSRIHYFIHIADLLEEDLKSLVIPVFLGDASYVPEVIREGEVEFLSYELRTLKTPISIMMPTSFARQRTRFVVSMLEYERLVKSKNQQRAITYIVNQLDKDQRLPIATKKLQELTAQLVALEEKGWNGIWARIITNFLTTACIGRFSNIVSNPPWIDWKSLPAGYRDKIKSLCIDRGLFSGAGRTGGINLNICALIAHVSATNWLQRKGCLAFLMPRELANQASYEGWRKSVGGRECSFREFHDWSDAGYPFDPVKEDFMTFFLERRKNDQSILPVVSFHKKKKVKGNLGAHAWRTIREAMDNLDIKNRVAGQIIAGSTAYTFSDSPARLKKFSRIAGKSSYIGREGIEFYPQELLLFGFPRPRVLLDTR